MVCCPSLQITSLVLCFLRATDYPDVLFHSQFLGIVVNSFYCLRTLICVMVVVKILRDLIFFKKNWATSIFLALRPFTLWEARILPMKALGMVIFSHMRSRTSRPDSGEAMALTMVAMSLWMDR